MTESTTHTLDVPGATLTYDVHEPDTASDKCPLFIFGSPMGASGFEQLVGHVTDGTVITYDPRGMERSTRQPGSEVTVEVHAEDTTASSRRSGSGRSTRSGRAAAACAACTGWSPTQKTCALSSHTSHR
jgi:hypothetical protein